MPKPFPPEFRADVVRVVRTSDTPIPQIAKDFGISASAIRKWVEQADVEDGVRPGTTKADSLELRAIKKRNRVLEQENEILRRAAAFFAKDISPK